MNVSLNNYKARRESGMIQLTQAGGLQFLTVRQFDPDTGKELPATTITLDKEAIINQLSGLLAQAQVLKEIIDDMTRIEDESRNPD